MENGVIVINYVAYEDPTRVSVQEFALYRLKRLCRHHSFKLIVLMTSTDACSIPLSKYDSIDLDNTTKRTSKIEIGGTRDLPFVRDLLDSAVVKAKDPGKWIGLFNSDVIVSDGFFAMLNSDNDIVLPVVTDIDHIEYEKTGPFSKRGNDPDSPMCCDGVFMRAGIWADNRDKVPDYVLGECYWDAGYLRHFGKMPNAVVLDGGECLHVKHKGGWDTGKVDWNKNPPTGMTVTGDYNLKLYYGE